MSRARPVRFPPNGSWPCVMRMDMAAAYFDCRDTGQFTRMVRDGEAPEPTGSWGRGKRKEPLWSRQACEQFVARRFQIAEHARADEEDVLADL